MDPEVPGTPEDSTYVRNRLPRAATRPASETVMPFRLRPKTAIATGVDVPPVGLTFATPTLVTAEVPLSVIVIELLAASVYSTELALKPMNGTASGAPDGSVKSSVPVQVRPVLLTRKMFVLQD